MIVRGGVITGLAVVVADLLLAELVMGRAHRLGTAGMQTHPGGRPSVHQP